MLRKIFLYTLKYDNQLCRWPFYILCCGNLPTKYILKVGALLLELHSWFFFVDGQFKIPQIYECILSAFCTQFTKVVSLITVHFQLALNVIQLSRTYEIGFWQECCCNVLLDMPSFPKLYLGVWKSFVGIFKIHEDAEKFWVIVFHKIPIREFFTVDKQGSH